MSIDTGTLSFPYRMVFSFGILKEKYDGGLKAM